jgi:hypothetical protein
MNPDNTQIDFARLQSATELHIRQHLQTALDLAALLEMPEGDRAKFMASILTAFESLPTKKS